MARKPQQIDNDEVLEDVEFEDENEERENEPRQRQPEPEFDDLQKLLTDLGGSDDAEARVFLQPGDGRSKMEYLFNFQPGDYSYGQLLEKVKNEYGGGDYRLHIRSGTRLVANRPFSVAKSVKPKEADNDWRAELERERQRNADQRFEMMMENMRQQQQQTMEMFKTIATSQQAQPQKDPIEMMTAMMTALEHMRKMSGADEKKDPYKELERILSLREKITGEVSDREPTSGDILMNAIKQFAPLFQNVLGRQPQGQLPGPQGNAQPQGGYAPRPNPAPAGEPHSAPQPQSPEEIQAALIQTLLGHSRVLVAAAQREGDPAVYAQMVLDFTEDEQVPYLHGFVTQPNAMQYLSDYVPDIAHHPVWFEEVRSLLLEALEENFPELREAREAAIREAENSGANNGRENGTHSERQSGGAGDHENDAGMGAPLQDSHADPGTGATDRREYPE